MIVKHRAAIKDPVRYEQQWNKDAIELHLVHMERGEVCQSYNRRSSLSVHVEFKIVETVQCLKALRIAAGRCSFAEVA